MIAVWRPFCPPCAAPATGSSSRTTVSVGATRRPPRAAERASRRSCDQVDCPGNPVGQCWTFWRRRPRPDSAPRSGSAVETDRCDVGPLRRRRRKAPEGHPSARRPRTHRTDQPESLAAEDGVDRKPRQTAAPVEGRRPGPGDRGLRPPVNPPSPRARATPRAKAPIAPLIATMSESPCRPDRLPRSEPILTMRPPFTRKRDAARKVAVTPPIATAQNQSNAAWSRAGSSTHPKTSMEALFTTIERLQTRAMTSVTKIVAASRSARSARKEAQRRRRLRTTDRTPRHVPGPGPTSPAGPGRAPAGSTGSGA